MKSLGAFSFLSINSLKSRFVFLEESYIIIQFQRKEKLLLHYYHYNLYQSARRTWFKSWSYIYGNCVTMDRSVTFLRLCFLNCKLKILFLTQRIVYVKYWDSQLTYSRCLINDNFTINYYYQTSNYIKHISCKRFHYHILSFSQILLNAVRQIEHKCKNLTELINPLFVSGSRPYPSYTKTTRIRSTLKQV